MPQYRLADQAKAEELDREAVAASAAGNHAGVVGDDYIRITVFLAAVLFLVGIGSTFKLTNVRYALITVGAVLLILATVLILRQPGIPGLTSASAARIARADLGLIPQMPGRVSRSLLCSVSR